MSFDQLPQHVQEKVLRFRQLEQTVQALKTQVIEIKRVLDEITNTAKELSGVDPEEEVWKTIGSIMFQKKSGDVLKELEDQKEILDLQLKSYTKQETQNRTRLEDLQKELQTDLQGGQGPIGT